MCTNCSRFLSKEFQHPLWIAGDKFAVLIFKQKPGKAIVFYMFFLNGKCAFVVLYKFKWWYRLNEGQTIMRQKFDI